MPIRPSERARYPKTWPAIRANILRRSGGQCECRGECGSVPHTRWFRDRDENIGRELTTRCPALNREASPFTGSLVVLTVAHLDHTPEHNSDDNLRAMCQSCHLNYDRDHHAETRAATLATQREAAGLVVLV